MGNPRNAYFDEHEFLSNSMLKVFDERPSKFEAMFITGTLSKQIPTDAMIAGSMTHSLVFEPENIGADWEVLDYPDRRTKACKEAERDAYESGKMPILQHKKEACQAIADAVRNDEDVKKILDLPGALAEHVIRWEQDGIKRKAKLDFLAPVSDKKCIVVDLKTTNDARPDAWAKHCRNFCYHRQAAWYRDAAISLGYTEVAWLYIIVEADAPYDVYVTRATEPEIIAGAMENATILQRLQECRETGIWKRPEQIGIWDNPVPPWA